MAENPLPLAVTILTGLGTHRPGGTGPRPRRPGLCGPAGSGSGSAEFRPLGDYCAAARLNVQGHAELLRQVELLARDGTAARGFTATCARTTRNASAGNG